MRYQQRQRRRLASVIAISVALHGWMLFNVVIERPLPKVQHEGALYLELTIVSTELPEQVIEEVPEPEPTLDQVKEPGLADLDQVKEPGQAETQPQLPSVLDLKRSLVAKLGGEALYQGPACTQAQRANEIRKCEPQERFEDKRQTYYANLFREAFGHAAQTNPAFGKDMDQVATLAARSERLAALDPADPVEASLLREQRAFLQQEISRIDRQYAEFNLLKLIPMGKRVVKGFEE